MAKEATHQKYHAANEDESVLSIFDLANQFDYNSHLELGYSGFVLSTKISRKSS